MKYLFWRRGCMKCWVRLVMKSCLKNREHEKTQYEIQSFIKYFSMMYVVCMKYKFVRIWIF